LENMKLNVDPKNIRDGLRFNVVHEWNPKKHPSIQSLHAVKSCPNIPKHLCILQKFAVQRSAQQPPRTGTLMYMLTLYQPVPGLKKKSRRWIPTWGCSTPWVYGIRKPQIHWHVIIILPTI
jgi:hypothetical protein